MKRLGILVASLLLSPGCVVVGGYSSGRGFFLWPGTIVLLLVALALFFVFRRRT